MRKNGLFRGVVWAMFWTLLTLMGLLLVFSGTSYILDYLGGCGWGSYVNFPLDPGSGKLPK